MRGRPDGPRRPVLGLALASALPLLVACAGGGGVDQRYYLVDPVPVEALATPGRLPAVQIVGLELPSYLDRAALATRDRSGRVRYAPADQWSESLRKNLLRTLAVNLAASLATADVGTPLSPTASPPAVRLQVTIEAFEAQADGHVVLAARWRLLTGSGPGVAEAQVLRSPAPVADGAYDAIVAAMRELFGRLSVRIATSVLASTDRPSPIAQPDEQVP